MIFVIVYKTTERVQVYFIINIKESWEFSEGKFILTCLFKCRPNFFKSGCWCTCRKVPDHRVDDIMNRKRKLFLYIRRK